jgi:hypothetical protein
MTVTSSSNDSNFTQSVKHKTLFCCWTNIRILIVSLISFLFIVPLVVPYFLLRNFIPLPI